MTDTALVLVDIQNDYFVDGKFPVHEMEAATINAARLLAAARDKGLLVLHVRHEIPMENAPFFAPGSTGAEIHVDVAPAGDEKVILKHRPNSFHNTSLKADLDAAGINTVVICGAQSQMCIDGTARASADFGYDTVVVGDACAAKEQSYDGMDVPAPQVHATIMSALNGTYARVVSTEAYLAG